MIKSYKLYLTLLISSVFIILCQNQISIANFVSSSSAALAGSNGPGQPPAEAQALIGDDLGPDDGREQPSIVDKIRSRSLTFNDVRPGRGTKSTDRTTTTLGSSSSSSSSSTASTSTSTTTRTTTTTTTAAPEENDISGNRQHSARSSDVSMRFLDHPLGNKTYINPITYGTHFHTISSVREKISSA